MQRRINLSGLIGGLIIIFWGLYIVITSELTFPRALEVGGPHPLGQHPWGVVGSSLILFGLFGVLGSFVNIASPILALAFLLPISLFLTILSFIALMAQEAVIFLLLLLAGIFYLACWSSIKATPKPK